MLCSAAAALVWVLAVLSPGLSLPAEDDSESGCSHCFYRQKPPQGASAGLLLQPLCHRLPGGHVFATQSKPTCDTAVYFAFRLSHGWTEREGQEEGDLVPENEDNTDVAAPALLRGGVDPSNHGPSTDPLLQQWDATIATLVQSVISPQCSTLEGDLYILTGAGRLGDIDDGDDKCQTKLLWSAVCCAVPEERSSFSVRLIREAGDGARQVSVKELEELLGVEELFSEGCGGADGDTVGITVDLLNEGLTTSTSQDSEGEDAGVDTTSQDSHDVIKSRETLTAGERAAGADAQAEVAQATSADAATSESEQQDVGAVTSESETVDEQETDANSSSTLLFVLSTTVYILKAPLQPVFSTITQLPGQVTYVLQEDLGVLSALPEDTFSLLHLLTSDLLSWIGRAADIVLGVGETSFVNVYHCTSSMLGALLDNCYAGATGMGTLAGDTAGIFGNALDNGWWVTKFFGGRLWEQSEGYVGSVMSEMGGQAKAAGGGFGRLAWRSGNGVSNIFRMGGQLILGMLDMIVGTVQEAFGQETES